MDSLKEIKNDLKNLDSIPTRVSTLEKEQEKLREKSETWDWLNTVGIFIAGLFGAFFGK